MPLTLTPPNATTRVYAKSLFELCMSSGGRGKVEETLDELEQVVELCAAQPDLGEIFASPAITSEQRAASISKIFKGRVSETTLSFLQVLNAKDRVSVLPGVVASFDEVVQEKFGTVEVDVFTAQPATPEMLRELTDRLSKTLGKQVVVHTYTEPNMIGGVKIKIGDQLLDASVATQLSKLKDQLTRDGTAAMRSRMGNILEG